MLCQAFDSDVVNGDTDIIICSTLNDAAPPTSIAINRKAEQNSCGFAFAEIQNDLIT
jgi:hypothetical protein